MGSFLTLSSLLLAVLTSGLLSLLLLAALFLPLVLLPPLLAGLVLVALVAAVLLPRSRSFPGRLSRCCLGASELSPFSSMLAELTLLEWLLSPIAPLTLLLAADDVDDDAWGGLFSKSLSLWGSLLAPPP